MMTSKQRLERLQHKSHHLIYLAITIGSGFVIALIVFIALLLVVRPI
jgi:hypothetical protein